MVVFIFIHSCGEFLKPGVVSYVKSHQLASACLTYIYYTAQILNPFSYCRNPGMSLKLFCQLQRPVKSSIKLGVLQTHTPLYWLSAAHWMPQLRTNPSLCNKTVASQGSDSGKRRLMVCMVKDVKDHKHLFRCVRMGSLETVITSLCFVSSGLKYLLSIY